MDELTPKLRRALRAKAHHLHPVVSVGQHGLTPQVLHEIDVALTAHGLVKIRVHSDDRAAREAMLADVAARLHAAPVQHLGKLLIVWRERDEEEAEPAAPAKPIRPVKPRKAAGLPLRPSPVPREARASTAPATRRRRRGALRTAPAGTFLGEAPRVAAAGDKRSAKPATKRAKQPAATRAPKSIAKPAAKAARPRRRRGT